MLGLVGPGADLRTAGFRFFFSQGKIGLLVQSCPCVCSPMAFKSFNVRETCYEYCAIKI
jgi:hypothetical protein